MNNQLRGEERRKSIQINDLDGTVLFILRDAYLLCPCKSRSAKAMDDEEE